MARDHCILGHKMAVGDVKAVGGHGLSIIFLRKRRRSVFQRGWPDIVGPLH